MSQAIITKYFGPSNVKGARIKASCERGSLFLSYPYGLSVEQAHFTAARALCMRFADQDFKRDKIPYDSNPWLRPFIQGGVKTGFVFVFAD